jgi:hypothetical protein
LSLIAVLRAMRGCVIAVLRAMRGCVGGWGGRGFLAPVLTLLLFRRLGGVCGDMERLCQRFQAGRLWLVLGRAAVSRPVEAEGARCVQARLWPGRFGWLVRAASWHAAGYGSQLAHVLRQPEMVALLLASPQARRILRPVCRMLAVDAALLRPRAVGEATVVAAEVVAVAKVRVRRPRVPIDWGRIPLPRGVLAAAKRQGFGKVPRD